MVHQACGYISVSILTWNYENHLKDCAPMQSKNCESSYAVSYLLAVVITVAIQFFLANHQLSTIIQGHIAATCQALRYQGTSKFAVSKFDRTRVNL